MLMACDFKAEGMVVKQGLSCSMSECLSVTLHTTHRNYGTATTARCGSTILWVFVSLLERGAAAAQRVTREPNWHFHEGLGTAVRHPTTDDRAGMSTRRTARCSNPPETRARRAPPYAS